MGGENGRAEGPERRGKNEMEVRAMLLSGYEEDDSDETNEGL